MSLRDIALAFLVVAVWGTNFVVIKAGLRDLPPFLFALLRFLFSALPFVFFLPRPRTPWRWIVLYGALIGAGQFGLLYYAMRADISPGLASLVIQSQAIFTIALSVWIFRERVGGVALAGVAIAAGGLAVIASHLDGSATPAGILIVLGAGLAWAAANVAGKKASAEKEAPFGMLAFIAWASVFAVPPLLALTLVLEGSAAWNAIAAAGLGAWSAVAWQVVGNTLFGWAAWSYLMARYDAAVVAPYALLVPVFGMGASALLLGEPLPAWKLAGGALVVAGIAAIVLSGTARTKLAPQRRAPAIGD
ncbi:MAG TPA: EamA family transporter [Usitatibacter sp.]|jgi:O-acetylserine/cysteine efflux transporter|nr:EamA family transporter [Usitatibacter sp.]